VHAPSEEKSDDSKDSFYQELEQVFNHFSKYRMKTVLGDLNAKVERENIFRPTFGIESLHQVSNDNGVRIVNFATSKNLEVESTTNRFASLENLSDCEDINRAWVNIKDNIKTSAKESLGLYEFKQHKTWFDEECLGFLDQRKQAKI